MKILINIILYAYEEEKIMVRLRKFLHEHLLTYTKIIEDARSDVPSRRKADFDPVFTARIAQIIVLATAMIESIDPVSIDSTHLMRYIMSLFRG